MGQQHEHPDSGPCVQRDERGNLRDRCGTGMIVASAFDTPDRLREWANGVSGVARANYEAALRVLRAEESVGVKGLSRRATASPARVRHARERLTALRTRVAFMSPQDIEVEIDDVLNILAS